MIHFEGAAARKIEQTAIAVLKVHLASVFAQPDIAGDFATYGGVQWLDDDTLTDPGDERESMQPEVFLSIDDHKTLSYAASVDGVDRTGNRHELKISAEILTSDYCYKAEPKLRDALREAITSNKAALATVGWFEAGFDPNPSRVNDLNKVNPMMISGVLYTLR